MKKTYFLLTAMMLLFGANSLFAYEESTVAVVGDQEFDNLPAAMAASSEQYPAVLQADITIGQPITIKGRKDFIDMNGYNITFTGKSNRFCMEDPAALTINTTRVVEGGNKITSSTDPSTGLISMIGAKESGESHYCELNVGEKVTLRNPTDQQYYIVIMDGIKYDGNKKAANGIKINFDGIVEGETSAFYINGNVKAITGDVPQINIGPKAVITTNGNAIYAAGYAIWNIQGSVTGTTCAYVKAGTLNIDNAKLHAVGTGRDPKADGSGATSTGDCIIMDSNKSYAGKINVSITGENTEFKSENGYAIQEALTNKEETATIGLTISNGTFIGGAGAIKYSDKLRQALIDGSTPETWILNAITGGKYSSNPFVSADDFVVVDTKSGDTPFVVQEATLPVPAGGTTYITSKTTLEGDYSLGEKRGIVVQTGAELEITGSLTIEDDIDNMVIVEPNAKFIVNSIVSKNVSNIILKDAINMNTGALIYSGSNVASPKGTCQLALSAKDLGGGNYKFQHFGVPTVTTPTLVKSVPMAFCNWNRTKGWEYVHSDALNAPFVGHNVTANTTEAGQILGFAGDLVTNQDATFALNGNGYTALSNSYTAPMDIQAIHNSLNGVSTDKELWIYIADNAEIKFEHIGPDYYLLPNPKITKLQPMQGFFLVNEGEETSFTVAYQDAVFSEGELKAAFADVIDGGAITISDGANASDLYLFRSDSYEGISGSKQFEGAPIKIYVKEGENKWATFKSKSFEEQFVEIETTTATNYTLTFSQLMNEGFSITDLDNPGVEIKVSEGGKYEFTATPSTAVKRFKLGKGVLDAGNVENNTLDMWVNGGTLYVANAESDIVVINAAGVTVLKAKANGNAVQAIGIADFANGMYIVESGSLKAKFIK